MIKSLDKILNQFRNCFSRQASFSWFVITTIGLMLRSDKLGLTSIIRDLSLAPKHDESLVHFFRSEAFSLEKLMKKWCCCAKIHL